MSNIFDLFKKIEKKEDAAPISFIVVGLGNIGDKYAKTRHNIGFAALDYITAKCGVAVNRVKFHSTVGEGSLGGKRVLFMKPSTLMNNSGVAIGEAAAFYKIPPENVIVLHDEISFDPGIIRIRRKGSAGGHNGLKSVIAHLSSEDFPRIKIGVGKKPTPEYDLVD
jgi:PTH1 family peptidyl-tRNA hydrolase